MVEQKVVAPLVSAWVSPDTSVVSSEIVEFLWEHWLCSKQVILIENVKVVNLLFYLQGGSWRHSVVWVAFLWVRGLATVVVLDTLRGCAQDTPKVPAVSSENVANILG